MQDTKIDKWARNRKRNNIVAFRLSDEEHEKLKSILENKGIKITDFFVSLIEGEYNKEGE